MRNSKKSARLRPEKISLAGEIKPPPGREEIRRRAYEIFLARDGATGDAVSDWLQAKRELEQGAPTQPVR
jgi:Protein of unknown function (DUF2934)